MPLRCSRIGILLHIVYRVYLNGVWLTGQPDCVAAHCIRVVNELDCADVELIMRKASARASGTPT
jgi:hypothetical protein